MSSLTQSQAFANVHCGQWWLSSAWKDFERLEAGTRCVKPEPCLSVEKARAEQGDRLSRHETCLKKNLLN
jgi:hypothetical protein